MTGNHYSANNRAGSTSKRTKSRDDNRHRLLEATREILRDGERLTIAVAAKRAGLSVATAYRHYSDLEQLRVDAALESSLGPDMEVELKRFREAVEGISDPGVRLVIAQNQMLDFVISAEANCRMFVATAHEQFVRSGMSSVLEAERSGLRIALIDAALEPVMASHSDEDYQELVHRLTVLTGSEPFFVLKDISGLEDGEIRRLNREVILDFFHGFSARRGLTI